MVNQVELHPYFAQPAALETMKYYNVQPEAWAPLGGGRHKCKYPGKPDHSLLEIFRHTEYVTEEIAMRKARFTEHQIIAVLKSVEAGRTVKDVCREAAISEASYYNWKAKFGGMEASDIKKMKDLEDENRRLKQMFADLSLECRALKDVIEKKL
ncbi:IS1400 transposase A [Pectobacterium parmentieri]|uniref:IS1400 transposase A n=1 Tax=Pectobacterium parmentieri TaxID=1905730 RepID=A0A0H3I9D5_PECPM|nr:IS1400 transposase A [Pectobacterium parmentieri]